MLHRDLQVYEERKAAQAGASECDTAFWGRGGGGAGGFVALISQKLLCAGLIQGLASSDGAHVWLAVTETYLLLL